MLTNQSVITDPSRLGIDFCTQYYDHWNRNPSRLQSLYNYQSKITYRGIQCRDITTLFNYLHSQNIFQIEYTDITANFQPLSNGLLIQTVGNVKFNKTTYNFVETIVLVNTGSQYYITNNIFNII